MPLLPESPTAIAGLAVSFAGLAYVAVKREMPKAYGLAFVILLVFAIQTAAALFLGGDDLPVWLGFRAAPFLAAEQWWSPVTYLFVHADLLHLVGNLFLLVSAGPLLEDRVGPARFLAIYLGAGAAALAAHLAFVYWIPLVGAFVPAVGASGALFGILTVLAFHWPRELVPFPFFIIIWLPAFVVLMIHLVLNLTLMFSATNVAWYGHFAGFVLGLTVAPFMAPGDGGARAEGLPDPAALEPLATTPRLKDTLERLRTMEGQTEHDVVYAEAWLDRFFRHAKCPEGHPLDREGYRARCQGGEFEVDFGR